MLKRVIVIALMGATLAVAENYTCIIDNLPMMWTGKTQVVDGVLLYQYRCLRGHFAWGKM